MSNANFRKGKVYTTKNGVELKYTGITIRTYSFNVVGSNNRAVRIPRELLQDLKSILVEDKKPKCILVEDKKPKFKVGDMVYIKNREGYVQLNLKAKHEVIGIEEDKYCPIIVRAVYLNGETHYRGLGFKIESLEIAM